jgi:hypothetical protein
MPCHEARSELPASVNAGWRMQTKAHWWPRPVRHCECGHSGHGLAAATMVYDLLTLLGRP